MAPLLHSTKLHLLKKYAFCFINRPMAVYWYDTHFSTMKVFKIQSTWLTHRPEKFSGLFYEYFYSILGQCKLTCKLDNDCFLGHVCLGDLCTVGCKVPSDCPTLQSCVGNKCTDPCSQESCGPNSQCTVTDQKAQCSCMPGFLPNPTAVIGCAGVLICINISKSKSLCVPLCLDSSFFKKLA